MRIRLERTVPFPRDDVYAWWTDFREDDHGHPGSPSRSVRQVIRRQGDELWLVDRATRPAHVTIREHATLGSPQGYSVVARYPGATVKYTYRFEPVHAGTRIALEAEITPRHLGHVVLPFLGRWARRYAERDTDFHVNAMSRELTIRATDRERPR